MAKKKTEAKKYVDPKTKRKVGYKSLSKKKVDGVNVIIAEKENKTIEYDYDDFALANPGFKSQLSD